MLKFSSTFSESLKNDLLNSSNESLTNHIFSDKSKGFTNQEENDESLTFDKLEKDIIFKLLDILEDWELTNISIMICNRFGLKQRLQKNIIIAA